MSNPKGTTTAERQLSEQGRAQAKADRQVLAQAQDSRGPCHDQPLQRAVDTGTLLGFGEVAVNPDLAEAGSGVSPEENNRRADALRKLVGMYPPADNNLVIVTHKPNIMEAFGKDWSDVREGEASVFEPDFAGAATG